MARGVLSAAQRPDGDELSMQNARAPVARFCGKDFFRRAVFRDGVDHPFSRGARHRAAHSAGRAACPAAVGECLPHGDDDPFRIGGDVCALLPLVGRAVLFRQLHRAGASGAARYLRAGAGDRYRIFCSAGKCGGRACRARRRRGVPCRQERHLPALCGYLRGRGADLPVPCRSGGAGKARAALAAFELYPLYRLFLPVYGGGQSQRRFARVPAAVHDRARAGAPARRRA